MPTITANDLSLYYEDHGDPGAPAVLLIMGLGTQMIAWPQPLIDGLVAAGYRVVAYDNRDVGQSQWFTGARSSGLVWAMLASRLGLPFRAAYSLTDMARDAIGLLDALGIARAHVVGASMGGMIAQLVAFHAPDRVISLTSVMSSSGRPGLPGPSPELRRRMTTPRPKSASREQLVAIGADALRAIAYPDPMRPDTAYAEMAARAYDRGYNPPGFVRQLLAIVADGSRVERLAAICAPTLVVHGAADQLVPLACGQDSARCIPGARMEVIEEMAHDLPPSQIDRMIGLLTGHFADAGA